MTVDGGCKGDEEGPDDFPAKSEESERHKKKELNKETIEVEFLTEEQLIKKAAASLCLKLKQGPPDCITEWFSIYSLDNDLIKFLGNNDFHYDNKRPDKVISLSTKHDGYWNFHKGEKLELILELAPQLELEQRGIVFYPHVWGGYLGAANHSAHYRVFQAIAEFDKNAHKLTHKIVDGEGKFVISWTDMQLGGLRSISALFDEFVNGNKNIMQLARCYVALFHPDPYADVREARKEIFYVPEPIQPRLLDMWKEQLKEYQVKISI